MAQVVIVSGPPGAGKSAACEALCERYDRTVHLRADDFYAAVRMGSMKPWAEGASRQNAMVSRAAGRAASAYLAELYAVFIDGVIGPQLLPIYLDELQYGGATVQLAVLLPDVETVMRRGVEREPAMRVPEEELRRMHAAFVAWGDFGGCRIDNSTMTADEAADAVMAACGEGRCVVTRRSETG